MAVYIRADKRKYKTYYWLVESHREGQKVVQRRLKSIGTELPTGERLEEIKRLIKEFERKLKPVDKPAARERKEKTIRRRKI